MKRSSFKLFGYALVAAVGLFLLGVFAFACAYVYVSPSLPSAESMRKVELQVPLRVYTRTGGLISQIGEQRRIPVTFDEIPALVRNAVLAAEDDRFFHHHGIDWTGVVRAMAVNLLSGDRAQGASTITMQASRNMFLTLDKTWRRKLQEVFVTYRMERDFSKQEILSTYLNVIFFGQRSYGVAAAAETYYGKSLSQLTVSEAATLAGIIQVPSRYNPMTSPALAHTRRTYVLRRMAQLGYIDAETARAANAEPILSRGYAPLYDVEAPYVAELARQEIVNRYGPSAVNYGYKVFTTLDGRLQTAANHALRVGLMQYDRRHGYRGVVEHATLPPTLEPAALDQLLSKHEPIGILLPAVVLSVAPNAARVHIRGVGTAQIDWDGMAWARPLVNGRMGAMPRKAADVVARGDVIYVVTDRHGNAQLAQVPEAQSALVAMDPNDGAVVSLVGGFDYYSNQFNRVTQAKRQPGSGFKPFLYSAALDNGFTPASIVLDTPLVIEGNGIEGAWRPQDFEREFGGPTRMREALVESLNLVSIRILRDLGTTTAIDYMTRFGFEKAALPDNLTLALGTTQATPLQMVTGYATFANGGYKVTPYLIDRIENSAGKVLYQAAPAVVCRECESAASSAAALEAAAPVAAEGAAAPPVTLPPLPPSPSPEQIAARNADAPAGLQALAAAQALSASLLKPERIAPRVITPQNDYLMVDMMADVIRRGTGRGAMVLGRKDLAGKTGTTNQVRDTWFNGFNANLVSTVWVGYDIEQPLGETEQGARTALPIWVHFMREALKGVPEKLRPIPPGIVQLRVSARTGAAASANDPDAITESFMITHLPPGTGSVGADGVPTPPQQGTGEGIF